MLYIGCMSNKPRIPEELAPGKHDSFQSEFQGSTGFVIIRLVVCFYLARQADFNRRY